MSGEMQIEKKEVERKLMVPPFKKDRFGGDLSPDVLAASASPAVAVEARMGPTPLGASPGVAWGLLWCLVLSRLLLGGLGARVSLLKGLPLFPGSRPRGIHGLA